MVAGIIGVVDQRWAGFAAGGVFTVATGAILVEDLFTRLRQCGKFGNRNRRRLSRPAFCLAEPGDDLVIGKTPDPQHEKRQNEKGIRMKTRIKLSAKMLIIAWTLMKRKERFNPEYLKD